jgi:hypothetical protein
MRDYGKVHTTFWTSETIRSMSEDGRALAFYLLTTPHGNLAGAFRLPNGYVCEDMQWTSERVDEAFNETLSKGFANRCETTKWVYIQKHFIWNPPENPNQRKSLTKIALSIPESCDWVSDFHRENVSLYDEETFSKLNPSETLLELFLNRFATSNSNSNSNSNTSNVASNADDMATVGKTIRPDCPHQKIIDLYHEVLPMCPRVRDWTPARATQLRARWNEDIARQNLEYWQGFFEYVSQSDFLCGRVAAKGGAKPFCVDLEWLTKSGNFVKIREGKYHE